MADVGLEQAAVGDLGQLLAGRARGAARSACGLLSTRRIVICPLPVGRSELLELLPGLLRLPATTVRCLGAALLSPLRGSLQVARIDPVEDGLGDELLDLVGVDVRLAATGESLAFGAGVAALAAGARAGDQPLRRSGYRRAGRRAGSGGLPCWCAAPGRPAAPGSALRPRRADDRGPLRGRHDLAVVGALAADPTARPASGASSAATTARRLAAGIIAAVQVVATIERTGSPASSRCAHSRPRPPPQAARSLCPSS